MNGLLCKVLGSRLLVKNVTQSFILTTNCDKSFLLSYRGCDEPSESAAEDPQFSIGYS